MMTSVGSSRARGSWEQTQMQTQSQTQHKQRPQATAEQIRLAQMISDHNDADFEEKVKQLIDITGKDQDESMIALHDCNGDVNRAINVLLEGNPDTDSWEMVGKKKGVSGQKDSGQTDVGEEGKENREKAGDKDVSRRRGGTPRRGRGASRGREFRGQENGLDGGKVGGPSGRGTERGRRGRGRGRGVSGKRGGRFSAQGMGQIDKGERYGYGGDERTFNPADYAEPAQTEESSARGSTWNNVATLEPDDGTSAWRMANEEWGTEDWNEDLSETKVFTASSVASVPAPQENPEPITLQSTQPSSLAQSLVFSNSKQGSLLMLSKGFGEVGDPKGGSGGATSGSQFLEQFKTAQALAQLAAQHTQTGPTNPPTSSWNTTSASLGQYDMKPQSEPQAHSPFTERQPYQPTSSAAASIMEAFLQDKAPPSSSVSSSLHPQTTPISPLPKPPSTPVSGQQMSPSSSDNQSSSPQPLQQHKLKQQRKRTSIATKIPSLAVEMPGSADISGLNLQFGALQFGSEPVVPEYDSTPATSAPASQAQNSLFTTASSDPMPNIPNPSQDQGYQGSSLPGAGSSYPPQTGSAAGVGQSVLFEQRATQTRRYPPSVSSSPQKDIQPSKNGFGSIQSVQSMEAAAGSAVSKAISDPTGAVTASALASLTDSSAAPVSLLTTPSQQSLSALGHSDNLAPSAITQPQHSNSLSTQQNSLAPSSTARSTNSSLQHSNVDGDSGLHSSSFPPSVTAVSASGPSSLSAPPSSASGVPAQPTLGPISVVNMSLAATNVSSSAGPIASSSSSSSSAATNSSLPLRSSTAASGKAPPNLPPGVPPLLPNPYIMAPGLLHAYPMYGYDDLQMLQTRIPLVSLLEYLHLT
ncbi:hypothetical protein JZ751_009926, partial [Albula glossodonta]